MLPPPVRKCTLTRAEMLPPLNLYSMYGLRERMDPASSDPFDPDSLRLPPGMVGAITAPRRPPRHRVGQPFLKGPIPWAWWAAACRLPGQALQVASAIRYRAGCSGP